MKGFIIKNLLLLFYLSLFNENVQSQDIKALGIGDKVPDILIKGLFNYNKSNIRLSEFKGKVIILDFWEIFCQPCIGALPKIQEMQEHFKNKVQVLTITKLSTKDAILQQLSRSGNHLQLLKKFRLPTVVHDDKLHKYFPFQFISHVVWINGDGNVVAFTGTEHITQENIQKVIDKRPLNWPVKHDLLNFDYDKALLNLSNPELLKPDFFFYSAFTGPLFGVNPTSYTSVDSLNKIVTINNFNVGLLDLCKSAITGRLTGDYSMKEVIFEAKEIGRYSIENNTMGGYYWTAEGTTENQYCYSISIPLSKSEQERTQIIAKDLSRWLDITLGIIVKKEKRMVNCLILRRQNQNDELIRSRGDSVETVSYGNDKRQFINIPFVRFVQSMNRENDGNPYVFNETGIPDNFKVDLDFNIKSFANLDEFKNALERYGLVLIEEKREREMFVITEKDWTPNCEK